MAKDKPDKLPSSATVAVVGNKSAKSDDKRMKPHKKQQNYKFDKRHGGGTYNHSNNNNPSSNPNPNSNSNSNSNPSSSYYTRGKSHTELLSRRKTLQSEILPALKQNDPQKHELVLRHYHGASAGRNDVAVSRMRELRQNDGEFERTGHYDSVNRRGEAIYGRKRMEDGWRKGEGGGGGVSGGTMTDLQRRSLQKRNANQQNYKPNKSLQRSLHRRQTKRLENALAAADAQEILHTHSVGMVEVENDMERTAQLTQDRLKRDGMGMMDGNGNGNGEGGFLNENVRRNIFELDLECGPYGMKYDRSGRHALLFGKRKNKGHVAIIDQHTLALQTEFFLGADSISGGADSVKDAIFLQHGGLGGGGGMMAVAQEKKVFIYDDRGVEIHGLDGHTRVFGMEFLPYHWLLATIGHSGMLQYQDTSTGTLVSQHRTKHGPTHVIRQNPFNAVIHLGHNNGVVTLWSPSSSEYLVKMLCHRGSPVTSLAIDRSGRYMATGGGDSQVKIWDLRTYKELHSYNTFGGPPSSMDISQTGILGVSHGCHSTFFRPDALKVRISEPYMRHDLIGTKGGKGPIETLRFRPFEDVCGLGHPRGISSIVIPGAGEPNLDSMEHFTNPYMDNRQRREAEVRSLLEKLSPDMIALDPDVVGSIEEGNTLARHQRLRDLAEEADARKTAEKEAAKQKREKRKMRGRGKISSKIKRKQKNVVDEGMVKLREAKEKERQEREMRKSGGADGDEDGVGEEAPAALRRFF